MNKLKSKQTVVFLSQGNCELIDERFVGDCEGDHEHEDHDGNDDCEEIMEWGDSDGDHSGDEINFINVSDDALHDLEANFPHSAYRTVSA